MAPVHSSVEVANLALPSATLLLERFVQLVLDYFDACARRWHLPWRR
jgi:hypothetical protein